MVSGRLTLATTSSYLPSSQLLIEFVFKQKLDTCKDIEAWFFLSCLGAKCIFIIKYFRVKKILSMIIIEPLSNN